MRAVVSWFIVLAYAAAQSKQPGFSTANLPLVFTPNVGQDRADVRFSSRGFGYGIYFTREETVLRMPKAGSPALRLRVASANPRATISGVDELPSEANYLMGQSPAQWHTGVPNFGKVMYRQILPSIDLIYYGRGRRLEYDFRVAPHANPKAIEMRIGGKEWSTHVTSAGDLDIAGGGGSVGFGRPVAYQIADAGHRREVKFSYAMKAAGGFGFTLGRYDRSRELVIDPLLVYSTYYGGTHDENVQGIAVDSQGNGGRVQTLTLSCDCRGAVCPPGNTIPNF